MLRGSLDNAARIEARLACLEALPRKIARLEHNAAAVLAAVDLADAAALERARPLLDAQISRAQDNRCVGRRGRRSCTADCTT